MEVKIDEVVRMLENVTQDVECYYLPQEEEFAWSDDPALDDYRGTMIPLPTKREINDYHIMEQFVAAQNDPQAREWLQNSLIGKGAFRRFRATCERFLLLNDWYDFQRTAYEDIAVMWCEENGIVYNFDKYYDEEDDEYYEDEEDFEEEKPLIPQPKGSRVNIVDINEKNSFAICYMVADFRVYLASLKGRKIQQDLTAAQKEINEYIRKGYPVFAIAENGHYQGYAVCRCEDDVVWLESLYVREGERRKQYGTRLLRKAEELAREKGSDTLYIYIHPNNELMISFLASAGYDVLNLIEVRKASPKEKLTGEYQIGDHRYRY